MKMPKVESIERYVCPICGYQDDCKEAVEECRYLHDGGHLKTVTTWYLTDAIEFEFATREEAEEALALAESELQLEVSWVDTDAFWRWKEGVSVKRHNGMRRKYDLPFLR